MLALATADALVLVAAPGPEVMFALVLLAVGLGGAALGALMAWRGKIAALALTALFGALAALAVVALAHTPTRLVLDHDGIELAVGPFQDRLAWGDIGAVDVRRVPLGLWVSLAAQRADRSAPPRRFAGSRQLFVGVVDLEPRVIEMRIAAWRVSAVH